MTLTQTAIITKQGITISIILLVLGIVSFTGYKIWHAYYLAHLPPVEEKPDLKFGPLPQFDFPSGPVSTSNFTYSLDTTTGGLPKVGIDPGFDKIMKVYFISQSVATFLSADRSTALAEKFGLTVTPDVLSETKYQFVNQGKKLIVDLENGNFTYRNEATISAKPNLDDDNKLVADFKQTLLSLGILKDDLSSGRNKVSKQTTSTVLISLWPAAINNLPLVTVDFNKSLVSAEVSGGADSLNYYISLDFTYYPVDTSTFATYPLKTAEVAFDDLKNNKGRVIVEPGKPQVSISSVSLGYYLPENYSPYLQPVFIFEGPHFVAYVPAISEQFQSSLH